MAKYITSGTLGRVDSFERVLDRASGCVFPECSLPLEEDLPVCMDHAMEIVHKVSRLAQGRIRVTGDPEQNRAFELERTRREANSVVYYVQIGKHVKIGTSAQMAERLSALRSAHFDKEVKLLAVEPGSYNLEKRRHEEFSRHRMGRTELFEPHPELGLHIRSLRALHRPGPYVRPGGRFVVDRERGVLVDRDNG